MADKAKIGVTGTGNLGTRLARDFRDIDRADLTAIADVSDENRTRAGERFEIPVENRYESHEMMLDGEDLDGVVIATPHTLHYEQIVAALDREIHTLCEKPLCTDLDHARELVRRSEEDDAVLMVGYQRHLDAAFRTASEALSERVGEPQFITAEVTQDWISQQRGTWRADPDLSGGGQLYDTGSHLLDVVLWTTELTPATVTAQMLFDDEEQRVDKQAGVTIQFENGAVANVSVSGDTPCVREHLHVWGSNGSFYVDGKDWDPRELMFIDEDNNEFHPNLDDGHSRNKSEAFIDAIQDDAPLPATPYDAMKVTAVTEAAYESARTGRSVDVDISE